MRNIWPDTNKDTSLQSITSKPITQQQYNDLVDRVNEAVEQLNNGLLSLDEFKREIANTFSTSNLISPNATLDDITAEEIRTDALTVANAIIADLTNTNATINEAIISVVRSPDAYFNNVTISSEVDVKDVKATTIESDSADITTLNADSITTNSLNVESFHADTYDTDAVNAGEGHFGVLDTLSFETNTIKADSTDTDSLNSEDATLGVIRTNTIVHNINEQSLDDQDYYILSIPEFENGTYRILGKNGNETVWSIEVWNSSLNWMFRWSQKDLGYIDRFTMNGNKLFIRVKGANRIYHISDTAENENILTIENDYLPEGKSFAVGDTQATYIANGIFLGEVRADNINFENVALTDIMLRNTIYIYNNETGVYESGNYDQILQSKENGKIKWVDVLNNTEYPTALFGSDKLVTANTVANYNGSAEVATTDEDVTISLFDLKDSYYSDLTITNNDFYYLSYYSDVTLSNQEIQLPSLKDRVQSVTFADQISALSLRLGFSVNATTASVLEIFSYLNTMFHTGGDSTRLYNVYKKDGTLVVADNVSNSGFEVTNNNSRITVKSNYSGVTWTVDSSEIAFVNIMAGGMQMNMSSVYNTALNNHRLSIMGHVYITDVDGYLMDINMSSVYTKNNTAHIYETTGSYPITELGDGTTVHGELNVADDVVIGGDLYVNGTMHTVDEETVTTQADTITLRANNSSALASGEVSGIVINKYNGTDDLALVADNDGTLRVGTGLGTTTTYSNVYYNDTTGKWLNSTKTELSPQPAGTLTSWTGKAIVDELTHYDSAVFTVIDKTSLEPLLTRDEASNLSNKALFKWDSSSYEAKTIANPTAANQSLQWNGTDYEWTKKVNSSELKTSDDFVYVRDGATTAGAGGIDVKYDSTGNKHLQVYTTNAGVPRIKRIENSTVTSDKVIATTAANGGGKALAYSSGSGSNHLEYAPAPSANKVLQYDSTNGYQWKDEATLTKLTASDDVVTGNGNSLKNGRFYNFNIDVGYGSATGSIQLGNVGNLHSSTSTTEPLGFQGYPVALTDWIYNNGLMQKDTSTGRLKSTGVPTTNNSVPAMSTTGTVTWTSLTGLNGKVAFIGTRAQYNTAKTITEGNAGFIPSGALVIITDENNYVGA